MTRWADVLIVEDEKKLRQFTGEILKFEGISSAAAEDGCKALDYFKDILAQGGDMPRIVMLDVNMPCLGGLDVYREISRAKWISRVVVIITSAISENIEILPGPAKTLILHKPYDVKALLNMVREAAPDLFTTV
jgi:DNA-binding response OmpR family regulator